MLSEDRRDRGPYHDEDLPMQWYEFALAALLVALVIVAIGATA